MQHRLDSRLYRLRRWTPSKDIGYLVGIGGINLLTHEETATAQGSSSMWFVIVGVIGLGLGLVAVIGLLAVARDLIVERPFEANSMDDGGTKGKSVGKANLLAAVHPGDDAR